MFKIIKTSTYNKLHSEIKSLRRIIESQGDQIVEAHKKLHHQTAKKLPIKKSKNK